MIPYFDVQAALLPTSTLTQTIATTSTLNFATSTEMGVFATTTGALEVPFYSQFNDVESPAWKKQACGVTSLAMLIEFYKPGEVSVNALLKQGIVSGAYIKNKGWSHQGLADLSKKYELEGEAYDYANTNKAIAFDQIKDHLKEGPVIASIYYKFDPKSTIPHLVVINNIDGDTVYYNDPAEKSGGKEISTAKFLKGWKKRFIVIRPIQVDEKLLAKK